MRQAFRSICGKMVDIVEFMTLKEFVDSIYISYRKARKLSIRRNVLLKPTAAIVKNNHRSAHLLTLACHVRTDKACSSSHKYFHVASLCSRHHQQFGVKPRILERSYQGLPANLNTRHVLVSPQIHML